MEQITDWKLFITHILDGKFSLDIRKIGNPVDFIKNQIGANAFYNSETYKFSESLSSLISETEFSPEKSLNNATTFLMLMDMGIEFLISDENFIKKSASLFLRLCHFKNNLEASVLEQREALKEKASLVIRKFIEKLKKENEIIAEYDFYSNHNFLKPIIEEWKMIVTQEKDLRNVNAIIGIIYLDQWDSIEISGRRIFFSLNKETNNFLFVSLLSDMQRVENTKVFNYFPFVANCKHYYPEFYSAIQNNCPYWIAENDVNPGVRMVQFESEIVDVVNSSSLLRNLVNKIEHSQT